MTRSRPQTLIWPDVRDGSSLCENSLEPRTRRIVFSIAFSQEKSPVQSVSTTAKLKQKFYAQVQRRSFHTAWVKTGKAQCERMFSALVGHCWRSVSCQLQKSVLSPRVDATEVCLCEVSLTDYEAGQ